VKKSWVRVRKFLARAKKFNLEREKVVSESVRFYFSGEKSLWSDDNFLIRKMKLPEKKMSIFITSWRREQIMVVMTVDVSRSHPSDIFTLTLDDPLTQLASSADLSNVHSLTYGRR
jgi:hypothetical protein